MIRGRRTGAVAVLAALVAVAGCAPSPPPDALTPTPSATGLRVMTYNVLGAQGDANGYNERAGWSARISQLLPDVVVLQEVQSDDLSAIVARTGGAYVIAAHLRWQCDLKGIKEGVAILVRSTIPASGDGTHVGLTCTDPTMKRVLVWADLQLDSGPFRVYGTHLTAGGGQSAMSRAAQINAIRDMVAMSDPSNARRWLLAGDLNVTPGSAGYRSMFEGYVDTVAEGSPAAVDPVTCPSVSSTDPEGLAHLLAHPDIVRACGYTAGWPKDDNPLGCDLLSLCTSWMRRRDESVRERIDYVMVPEGGPIDVHQAFVPNRDDPDWASPGSEWFRLSDHLPTVVDLSIR